MSLLGLPANVWCRLRFNGDDSQPVYVDYTGDEWRCDNLPETAEYLNRACGYDTYSPADGWPPAFLAHGAAAITGMKIVAVAPQPQFDGTDIVY